MTNQTKFRLRRSPNRSAFEKTPRSLTTHEMQRPKICARAGSAARLNAGSHPTGGCALAPPGNEAAEMGFSGNRSPLFARMTKTLPCAVFAKPGLLTTAGNAPAIRPTAIATAIAPLSFLSISASPLWRRVGSSGQVTPLHVSQWRQWKRIMTLYDSIGCRPEVAARAGQAERRPHRAAVSIVAPFVTRAAMVIRLAMTKRVSRDCSATAACSPMSRSHWDLQSGSLLRSRQSSNWLTRSDERERPGAARRQEEPRSVDLFRRAGL
jgi:hypothetical protein